MFEKVEGKGTFYKTNKPSNRINFFFDSKIIIKITEPSPDLFTPILDLVANVFEDMIISDFGDDQTLIGDNADNQIPISGSSYIHTRSTTSTTTTSTTTTTTTTTTIPYSSKSHKTSHAGGGLNSNLHINNNKYVIPVYKNRGFIM